ncbi:NAD-dependent epimerase [Aquibacillus sediminis]|uniref:NAD-dependent epimerase n=1 Tax=Aquibacillus sediminis TaxID=2574734 RepID=UPI001108A8F4|nr:NAD-dependent epimerase [Aquibacillus sediminis]
MAQPTILITGVAGFIGYHLANRLLTLGYSVIGIDNLNDYYDANLKRSRLNQLLNKERFNFYKVDIANYHQLNSIFKKHDSSIVIHLAAQAGVRYSLEHPFAYVDSNLVGFANILEVCRQHKSEHLIYASSSSVYGANRKLPFSTTDSVDHPVSLYAATKKANELMAHTYSHLFHLPTTGLRFFTVYGPWGRPDMAYYAFTKRIMENKEIEVFNNGDMKRDFTYIDDIVDGIIQILDYPPKQSPSHKREKSNSSFSNAPYTIYNIGHNQPVHLMDFIATLEKLLGKKANLTFLPMQPGDMKETYADIDDLQADFGFSPRTPLKQGLAKFVNWYKTYYREDSND